MSCQNPMSLQFIYHGWETTQHYLTTTLVLLSSEGLALRAAPPLRSIGMIATHLIGVRAGWLYYVLEQQDERLVVLDKWSDRDLPVRSANELVRGLDITWQAIANGLAQWTIEDLAKVYCDVDENGKEETFSLQWILWHLLEHDLLHTGEISMILGVHNLSVST